MVAVSGVSLELASGETLALLGPSGCGKSTLLRLIAGLERPDSGTISVGGREITSVPPHRRDMGMIFQDYALFPHLDVAGNIGFAPVEAGWSRSRTRARVAELLDLVSLTGLADRKVFELSGGQQQRVALARALALQPSLLLLDEPLSNLDPELRGNLQVELRELLEALDVSAIYVTHDQDEAFEVAPRIAVMRAGRIVQEGDSSSLLADPRDPWTARFLGYRNVFAPGEVELIAAGREGLLVRDDLIRVGPAGSGDLSGRVTKLERKGRGVILRLALPAWGVELSWDGFERELPQGTAVGSEVGVEVPPEALVRLESG